MLKLVIGLTRQYELKVPSMETKLDPVDSPPCKGGGWIATEGADRPTTNPYKSIVFKTRPNGGSKTIPRHFITRRKPSHAGRETPEPLSVPYTRATWSLWESGRRLAPLPATGPGLNPCVEIVERRGDFFNIDHNSSPLGIEPGTWEVLLGSPNHYAEWPFAKNLLYLEKVHFHPSTITKVRFLTYNTKDHQIIQTG